MLWKAAPTALLLAGAALGQSLDQRIASMLPTEKEERFLQVPWRLDLMAARAEAQDANKPLFLWAMNGHPMGST